MGNSCAKGENRSDIDNMQPAQINNSTRDQQGSQPSSAYTNTDGGENLTSSKISFQSSFQDESQSNLLHNQSSTLKIEDFQLLKVVGRGSFGKVYMAKKKDNGKIYAVKVLKKDFIIRTNQVNNTKIERDIMQQITHPFVVKLHYAFQSQESLYFVTDFLNGGELFFHLCNEIRFSEDRARFYAAEIILALSHLHSNGIIYRDLKPENVLLDSEGHLKLTDFGLSKVKQPQGGMTNTFCGTPEYLAPEVIKAAGHSFEVDWWSLGMLLYEMISGINPFKQQTMQGNKSRHEILRKITEQDVEILPGFSPKAADLLRGLLQRDPANRLNIQEIQEHPFFESINWNELFQREATPPYVPKLKGQTDIRLIDTDFTNEAPQETLVENSHLLQTTKIEQFTYGGEAGYLDR